MYWGGKQQDVEALFREYCRLFYGPAEQEMLAFFTHCEAHWQEMEKDKAKADHALALFAKAQAKAAAASVYGRRLALIDDFLKGLRNKSAQLAQKRGPVPKLRLVGEARGKILIDGKLDDEAWTNCPVAATGRLRELQTGRQPVFGTTVKSVWIGNNLYFAIRCEERRGEKPNITSTRKDDSALWYGDAIEILLETDSHSYYQIAVNPAGAVVDMDRSAPKSAWASWDSQAEVATQVAEDHWTVEIRIPVKQDENDPLHQVIGRKPTQSLPWHINICRQRIRQNGQEASAFSPTGASAFHNVMKFAHFYDGRSHEFEADPTVTDYLIASRAASERLTHHKHAEAIAAFTALANGKITDFQKSAAWEQAASATCSMKNFTQADDLAARIPIEAVKKTVFMHNLLAQQKASEVIARFGKEDISVWPFWQQGAGYLARGHAHVITKAGKEAEADLTRALEWTSDPRLRDNILLNLGQNRETNLRDDDGALRGYREIIATSKRLSSADQFHAVQAIARILTRRRQFDEAIAILHKADIANLRGVWRGSMLLSLAETQEAAGRKDEALAICKTLLADQTVEPRQRKTAEEKIGKLKPADAK
jgi:tetratricopeptide (TPR) repeat protein